MKLGKKLSSVWSPKKKSGKGPGKAIVSDPQGSYTGRPWDPYEIPVQDVDDL